MITYKFGKLPARVDVRTLKLKDFLVKLPPIPNIYDVDVGLNVNIPESYFGNNDYGDCVIAARANQTLRFEYYEQKQIVPITDKDCIKEYWNEEGCTCSFMQNRGWCPDRGLDMLASMNEWRKKGWKLSNKTYTIFAYALVNKDSINSVMAATYLLNGLQVGIQVPQSAIDQFNNGQVWEDVGDWNIVGGHAIFIVGYNLIGPVCVTWSKKQQMTWKFFNTYTDEIYALIDNKDSWVKNDILNIVLLEQYLKEVSN